MPYSLINANNLVNRLPHMVATGGAMNYRAKRYYLWWVVWVAQLGGHVELEARGPLRHTVPQFYTRDARLHCSCVQHHSVLQLGGHTHTLTACIAVTQCMLWATTATQCMLS
eukprot:1161469-Pelagomonas_calceolata.AAC.14